MQKDNDHSPFTQTLGGIKLALTSLFTKCEVYIRRICISFKKPKAVNNNLNNRNKRLDLSDALTTNSKPSPPILMQSCEHYI